MGMTGTSSGGMGRCVECILRSMDAQATRYVQDLVLPSCSALASSLMPSSKSPLLLQGDSYGPKFTKGDTVGACYHLAKQEIFFTCVQKSRAYRLLCMKVMRICLDNHAPHLPPHTQSAVRTAIAFEQLSGRSKGNYSRQWGCTGVK